MAPTVEERPVKRLKTDKSVETSPASTDVSRDAASVAASTGTVAESESVSESSSIDLPSELWAHCCHYLPYSDVKNVAATSSNMLHHVMPAISRIHVFNSNELQASHASRLPCVEQVYLYCLLHSPPDATGRLAAEGRGLNAWSLEYSMETQYRVVPYLCRLPKLRFVFLGAMAYWQDRSRHVWNGTASLAVMPVEPTRVAQADRGSQGHRTLVQAFCGAFATRCLKRNFTVEGLFHAPSVKLCPFGVPLWLPSAPRRRRQCPACNHVLRHFPSEWLIRARGTFLCATPTERFQQVIKRDGDDKLLKDTRVVKRLVEEGFRERSINPNGRFHNICLMHATLQDIKALVDLSLLDPKTFDTKIFYNSLRKIKKEKSKPIRFSEQDWKALIAMGFHLEQSVLVNDLEIPLHITTNSRGRDMEDFLQERRERMQERGAGGGIEGGGIDDGFLNFLRNVGADVHVHAVPPNPFAPRNGAAGGPNADPGGRNADAPPNPGANPRGRPGNLPPWFVRPPPRPDNGGDHPQPGLNAANGEIEVNIVEGGDIDVGPVFANIFDHVQNAVRDQLGDEHVQRFNDFHDAVLAGDGLGDEDDDLPQGMGGIMMGEVVGMPRHLAMGFGGPPRPPGAGGIPPMFARMPDAPPNAPRWFHQNRPQQPPRRGNPPDGAANP
jgi:hypothetical protein